MPAPYKVFGAEMSPYSVKVRAYARYKSLPHQWLNRGGENAAEPLTRRRRAALSA